MDTQSTYARHIERVWTVEPQQQSENHTVGMVLEPGNWTLYDPFLFLAEDWFTKGTFDVHPHRGIETVTYVIEGRLNHYDNRFGEGQLAPGDVQWMTAGRGVIHQEDAAPGEIVHSLQLWINLQSHNKMTAPRYQNLRSADMPTRHVEGGTVRIFSGSSGGIKSNTQNHVPVTMLEIQLEPGAKLTENLPGGYNGFIYILEGSGYFGENRQLGNPKQVLWLSRDKNVAESILEMTATTKLRVLLYAGQPVEEPVAAYGPFVMNTQAQIKQAFEDYASGKFGQ
ncbi:hypothetical protein AAC03nite_05810 [Alicyclobacillus acidoterrestris]|uniref:pirin family protein n=1 Tax=Alicyclobacillus suci TaxID=2816080 RepID=UPI00119047FF|nr:pirin family protein [Alicyclobacillus suci]GEO24796.1 hypothetical protein AAC03nite_05810 [Alicyclobacillus acidoterrestris]